MVQLITERAFDSRRHKETSCTDDRTKIRSRTLSISFALTELYQCIDFSSKIFHSQHFVDDVDGLHRSFLFFTSTLAADKCSVMMTSAKMLYEARLLTIFFKMIELTQIIHKFTTLLRALLRRT